MKYLYALAVVVVMSIGIAVSIYLGHQPQSIVRVTYHGFQGPKEMTDALHTLLRDPLKEAPLLLLGVTPGEPHDLEFWREFLVANGQGGDAYQVIVVDPKLPGAVGVFPKAVQLDLKNEIERFAEGVNNAKAKGLRMAVIAPTIYTSQAINGNSAQILESHFKLKPFSLSLVKFPRSEAEQENSDIPCKLGDQNREGTGALGCAIEKRAKVLYRTKPPEGAKFEGLVDQLDERDFLIFWNSVKTP
jgi:hypothetical protein